MSFLAYAFGFLAAVANAAANVLQRAANRDESEELEFSLKLIGRLLRKRVWLAGVAAIAGSFFLQAAGLGLGTLAAIEPLLVLELPLTLIASAIWLGGALGRREWLTIIGMSVGTIALIAFLGPQGGNTQQIAWWIWFIAIVVTVGAVAVAFWLGHHYTDPGRRSALLGIGTGVAYGLAAALTKGMTVEFTRGGIVGVLTAWELYAAIVVGVFAAWLHQNAVNAGRLVAAQPGVTLADPYVSIIWGAVVFGETFRSGFWIVLAIAGGVLMSACAVILAGASALHGEEAAQEEGHRQPEAAQEG